MAHEPAGATETAVSGEAEVQALRAEVERLRREVKAWRALARGHCGSRCTDKEHERLLGPYRR